MFFKKKVDNPDVDGFGRVYVMKFELEDGTILHKVGMCNTNRSKHRMMEVLESFFDVYRYVPKTRLRKDKKVIVPLLVEKHIHRLLDEWSYKFDNKFDGSTEFFKDLDESVLLDYLDNFDYSELLAVDNMRIEDYDLITAHLRTPAASTQQGDSLDRSVLPF